MAEWLNTVVTEELACPRCGAQPGQDCRMPSGRKYYWTPHTERLALATSEMRERCRFVPSYDKHAEAMKQAKSRN